MSNFINDIAKYVIMFAPEYGIKVHSPIIAQAILESASGTSELAVNAFNYFGLKHKPAVTSDYYIKVGSEQNADGSYTSSVMKWCKFNSMAAGVEGYFKFINNSRYANLKGVTDPKTYLENIKADGYATSLKYVDNLMAVINKYNLTQYDIKSNPVEVDNKMRINVHAGHNPDGKVACGAVGLIKESTEARLVKNEVIKLLKSLGHTVYDCTEDNGKNQSDVLQKIVTKCNANSVDLDVSIHFNSGANDKGGNGVTTGTEVLLYNSNSKAKVYAENTVKAIAALGFKNRGVKYRSDLYVLKNTKAPAMLIECCFVDDKDDVNLYDYKTMAQAIVKGITGQTVKEPVVNTDTDKLYRVQCGAFKVKANAEALQKQLIDAGFKAVIV